MPCAIGGQCPSRRHRNPKANPIVAKECSLEHRVDTEREDLCLDGITKARGKEETRRVFPNLQYHASAWLVLRRRMDSAKRQSCERSISNVRKTCGDNVVHVDRSLLRDSLHHEARKVISKGCGEVVTVPFEVAIFSFFEVNRWWRPGRTHLLS